MLYVVRHGKTGWNQIKRTMGRMDVPLCKEGIEEAKKIKDYFEDKHLDLIICSPLTRAKETAKIITESANSEILYDGKLVERSMGSYEFRHYPDIEENNRIWDIEINSDENQIEPMLDFKDRVFGFIDEVVEKYQDKDVLLVTHGGVTALINCYFNDSLFEGYISSKFLKHDEVATYDIKKAKKMVFKPDNSIER